MRVYPSSRFKRSYKKLSFSIKDDFNSKIKIFFRHPFDSRLKTHKLRGKLDSYYAFYLREGYRVLFVFEDDDNVLLINVGSHDDYARWSKK
ncbi:MAG TPA: type II toxin-antitoxin system mRNA interferase toxin, RelE/StbE family [Patescibacteria group bacterium]